MNFYDESLRRNVSLHAATDKINIPGVFTIGGHGYPVLLQMKVEIMRPLRD